MALSFLPNRDRMCKEIEMWVALGKVDTLLSVCDCCTYKVYDFILPQECRTCNIRKGLLRIAEDRSRHAPASCPELTQAC